ncbi:MAG: ribose-phosphate diphosphokinase [Legionella longbeachae]|nr:ribose-phosphate diphosphokinase [Legionella longbeachae]
MDDNILFALPGNLKLSLLLTKKLKIELGKAEIRSFPDGESYIRIDSEVQNKIAILVCTFNDPNSKVLTLLFMARTLKELGAKKIFLVSPYLSYMRQDKQFHNGEAITSILFAQLISNYFDGLITIDPHLHRIHKLSEIYNLSELLTLHSTKNISEWIINHVNHPFLIGPDAESRQWISEIADYYKLPFVIGEKKRLGDREVVISLPEIKNIGQTPVLVDDVISTGVSMLGVLKQLQLLGFKKALCIGVHALFDEKIENKLLSAGAEQVISCNTIIHKSNQIDISDILAQGIVSLC